MADSLFNIEQYGCVAYQDSGTFDNASALQEIVNAFGVEVYGRVFVPGKTYCIGSTINITGNKISMVGTGRSDYFVSGVDDGYNLQSTFAWIGENGGTMFNVATTGSSFDSIALYGKLSGEAENQPAIGVSMSTNSENIFCPHLTVAHCNTGIVFNSPKNTLDNLIADNCNVGVYNSNSSALENRLAYSDFDNCPTGLYIADGYCSLDNVKMSSGTNTLVKIDTQSSNKYVYRFSNINVTDTNADGVILDASTASTPSIILFDFLNYNKNTASSPLFKINDNAFLILDNGHHLVNNMIQCEGSTGLSSTVKINNGQFVSGNWPQEIVSKDDSTGPWNCIWNTCINEYGYMISGGITGEV